jgi:predicted GH43/DUF377 family glycosyl hydrolase
MADEKKATVYRVGYIHASPERAEINPGKVVEGREITALVILDDYRASSAAAAVKMALDDSEINGGVPGQKGQRMVAVPVSRWSEFAGTAEPKVEWAITPIEGAQAPAPDPEDT